MVNATISFNIMAIDKQKAMDLKLSGLTHQQVAEQIGCSIDWCKRNLKGVRKRTKDSSLVDEIRRIGRASEGITKVHVFNLVREAYPKLLKQDLIEKVSETKKAARRGCKDVTIRPDWMLPGRSKDSLGLMMSMAQEVFDLMNTLGDKYRQEFNLDASYQKGIVYELSKLSAGENNKLMPMGLVKYGAHLEGVADTMDERHKQQTSHGTGTSVSLPTLLGIAKDVDQINNARCLVLADDEIPY
jgi:hypothetical protein